MNFSQLTTLQIGGPIKEFVAVRTEEQLINNIELAKAKKEPFMVIGAGSNLLVSDSGFEGIVIKNEVKGIQKSGLQISAKSGVVLQDLVDYANHFGLMGFESLAGIPGTVGGAVYGNAGAYGQTISDNLVSVKVFDINDLKTNVIEKKDCGFLYRYSSFKKNKAVITEVIFELTPGDSETLKRTSEEIIKKRSVKYPPGIKCPGSFFKNIVAADLPAEILAKIPSDKIVYGKVPAGSLLEMVGAKGDFLGQIKIMPYHANLFINEGRGTAEDFYNLAKKYFEKVKSMFGILLEPEVQFINLAPLQESDDSQK